MPRANRFFLPNKVWHITHRCHKREFLLQFSRDRRSYIKWLFEAKKRFKLRILNFCVTSNHIHLLLWDSGKSNIPAAIQLIASRVAQEYNQRKNRNGAFWEDRYHATAIDSGVYLFRCMLYIDLNMVRAGKVKHPKEWGTSAFQELLHQKSRYQMIDHDKILELLNFRSFCEFKITYEDCLDKQLRLGKLTSDATWSKSIAVGSRAFVESFKDQLGTPAIKRKIAKSDNAFFLSEESKPYNGIFNPNIEFLRGNNSHIWQ